MTNKWVLEKVMPFVVARILQLMDADEIRSFLQTGLKRLEDKIVTSTNKYDDTFLLPLIELCQEILDSENGSS